MDTTDDGYPEIPLRPEFRVRLIRTVGNALALRRQVLLLAAAATGHRVDHGRCPQCEADWPCREVLRAAGPVLDRIARLH